MDKHIFNPHWDEQEKGYYCTVCGVLKEEHGPLDSTEPANYKKQAITDNLRTNQYEIYAAEPKLTVPEDLRKELAEIGVLFDNEGELYNKNANELAERLGAAEQLLKTQHEMTKLLGAERDRLRGLSAAVYQFLGVVSGIIPGLRPWLDAASAAAQGEPFNSENLLPYDLPAQTTNHSPQCDCIFCECDRLKEQLADLRRKYEQR